MEKRLIQRDDPELVRLVTSKLNRIHSEYPELDPARIKKAFFSNVVLLSSKNHANQIETSEDGFQPDLEDYLTIFEPEDALLKVLEYDDSLDTLLTMREVALNLLSSQKVNVFPLYQLYNLDDLKFLFERFRLYMYENQSHILKTGYPESPFPFSLWLGQFACLYPTKHHDYQFKVVKDHRGQERFEIKWTSKADIERHNIQNEPLKFCEYEISDDYIDGMDIQTTTRLEEERVRFFNVKIKIVEEIIKALTNRRIGNLQKHCVQAFADTYRKDEIDSLFQAENIYDSIEMGKIYRRSKDFDYRSVEDDKASIHKGKVRLANGGLIETLEMVGYVSKEIDLGVMSRTRDALRDLIVLNKLGVPELQLLNYFTRLEPYQRENLDKALDQFVYLKAQEKPYMEKVQKHLSRLFHQLLAIEEVSVVFRPNTQQYDALLPFLKYLKESQIYGTLSVKQHSKHKTGQSQQAKPILIIDEVERSVSVCEEPLKLEDMAFDLLLALAKKPAKCCSNRDLLESIWGADEDATTKRINDQIYRLRQEFTALKKNGKLPAQFPQKVFRNHPKQGYSLELEPSQVQVIARNRHQP